MDIYSKVETLSKKAKEEAYAGNIKRSLVLFKEAYNILPLEKLKRRISKLKELVLKSESSNDDDDDNQGDDNEMVDLGDNFLLHQSIANQLYSYQKEGVLWFWRLYNKRKGGILGDDMGLGKTIQVIAYLAGMYDAELIKSVLIVAPVAVLVNWEKELHKWAAGIRVKTYHGSTKLNRLKNLQRIQQSEGVLLTTYGMIVSNYESFGQDQNGEEFIWDYIILDEGHKIKNPCKTSKCVRMVPAKYHYILTGTPVQNNLSELWALFDFTQKGTLLGTEKTFKMEFENPIVKAREKGASSYQQEYGNQLATKLREIIAPYFLRRTKDEVFKKNPVHHEETEKALKKLKTKKRDLVVWVYLSELQQKLYHGFIQSERVKQTLMSTRSPLAELQLLKKISDHPRLQSTLSKLLTSSEERETRLMLGIDKETEEEDEEENKVVEMVDDLPVEDLIKDSGKMVFLVYLMENLKAENHRTVIFSQSIKMLDIIQKVLRELGHSILRIDGRMKNPQDRENVLDKFKEDLAYNVLLMTTQIGSVGITLTCADRLVIFDPSWNPGTDAQAVDRVYRIGQEKDVVVYRLVTCGSIEEKIYRKQIFKNAIMKQTTGASDNPYRYFTNLELRELFSLDDPRVSTTQIQLQEMHPYLMISESIEFEQHLQFLKNPCIFGISHHDMLFSHEANNDNTDHEIDIQAQVLSAMNLISREHNESEIKLPQKKNRNNETSNKFLHDYSLKTDLDSSVKKELGGTIISQENLIIDQLVDTSNHLQENQFASCPSVLDNSDEVDDIMNNINKMKIKTGRDDDPDDVSDKFLDNHGQIHEPTMINHEYHHSQYSFQNEGSLYEDDRLKKDEELHENESIHKDKHLQENESIHKDKHLPENESRHEDKHLQENKSIHKDKHLHENESIHKDKHLQANESIHKDKHLQENESILEDKHLQENESIHEDRNLQNNETFQDSEILLQNKQQDNEESQIEEFQHESFHEESQHESLQENINSFISDDDSVQSQDHKLEGNVENVSLYEAVDNGCDPISETSLNRPLIENKIGTDRDASSLRKDATEIDFSINSCQTLYDTISTHCNRVLAPEVSLAIRNLGKLYRTPPVSPMVKKTLLDLSIDQDFKDFSFTNDSRVKEGSLIKHTKNKNLIRGGQATSTPIPDQKLNKLVDISQESQTNYIRIPQESHTNSIRIPQESHTNSIKNSLFDGELNNGNSNNNGNNSFNTHLNDIPPENTEKVTVSSKITSFPIFNNEAKITSTEDLIECSKVTSSNVDIHLNSYDLDFLEYGISEKRVYNSLENHEKKSNIKSVADIATLLDIVSDGLQYADTLPINMQNVDTLPVNTLSIKQNDLSLNTLFIQDKLNGVVSDHVTNKATNLQFADTLPIALNTESRVVNLSNLKLRVAGADVFNPELHEKSNKLQYNTFSLHVDKSFENKDFSPSPNFFVSDDSSSFDFQRSKVSYISEKTNSIIEDSGSNDAVTCQNAKEVSEYENKKDLKRYENKRDIKSFESKRDIKLYEDKESIQKEFDRKLTLLKELCIQNMGDLNIDDHVLIKVAQLAKDLRLVDAIK